MEKSSIGTFIERLKSDKVFLQNLIKKTVIALALLVLAIVLVVVLVTPDDQSGPSGALPPDTNNPSDNPGTEGPTDPENPTDPEDEIVYGDPLAFRLSADGTYYVVTGYSDPRHTDIVIPDTHDGLPVKEIAPRALYFHPAMRTLTIGDNVERIGAYAVSDCNKLVSVTLGDSVEIIDSGAFALSEGLTSVVIPDSVTHIGSSAFYLCEKLLSVTLGDSLEYIGADAFLRCTKLIEVVNNSPLNVGIGNTDHGSVAKYATVINRGASKLDTVDGFIFCKIGADNYLVGYDSTSNVISLPESYKGNSYKIHDYAFYNYHDIVSVTVPESIGDIGEFTFVGCYRLVEVINLSELEIASGMTDNGSIARYALAVHNEDSRIESVGDFLYYNYTTTHYLVDYIGTEPRPALPDEDYMFEKYAINQYAFFEDRVIREIYMPNKVSGTGTHVFYDCVNLQSVRLSESLSSINSYMFRGCSSLTSITLPESVLSIGSYAFHCCYKLTEIVNHTTLELKLGSKDHGSIGEFAKEIHVELESKLVRVDDFIFYVGDNTNYLISHIGEDESITLPADFRGEEYKINAYAFFADSRLKSVTISDSVTSIGRGAFAYCYKLTELTLGTGVELVEASAFSECTGIENVFFRGGEIELMSLTIQNDNLYMLDCVRYYSVSRPSSPSGYWHYDRNGNPVLWS